MAKDPARIEKRAAEAAKLGITAEAEEAVKAMEDAERTVEKASEELDSLS